MEKQTIFDRLKKQPVLMGSFLALPSPALVEMLAHAGFDLVLLDMEHGTFDKRELEECLRAADLAGISSLVRVPDVSLHTFQTVLDLGAGGVQAAMVHDVKTAKAVSSYAHYPPMGVRGMSCNTRMSDYAFKTIPELLLYGQANTFTGVQIESAGGLRQAGEILSVEGVDMVFVGAADLSVSLGCALGSPELLQVVKTLGNQIQKANKIAGIYVWDAGLIPSMVEMGYRILTVTAMDAVRDGLTLQKECLNHALYGGSEA